MYRVEKTSEVVENGISSINQVSWQKYGLGVACWGYAISMNIQSYQDILQMLCIIRTFDSSSHQQNLSKRTTKKKLHPFTPLQNLQFFFTQQKIPMFHLEVYDSTHSWWIFRSYLSFPVVFQSFPNLPNSPTLETSLLASQPASLVPRSRPLGRQSNESHGASLPSLAPEVVLATLPETNSKFAPQNIRRNPKGSQIVFKGSTPSSGAKMLVWKEGNQLTSPPK